MEAEIFRGDDHVFGDGFSSLPCRVAGQNLLRYLEERTSRYACVADHGNEVALGEDAVPVFEQKASLDQQQDRSLEPVSTIVSK